MYSMLSEGSVAYQQYYLTHINDTFAKYINPDLSLAVEPSEPVVSTQYYTIFKINKYIETIWTIQYIVARCECKVISISYSDLENDFDDSPSWVKLLYEKMQ